MFIIKRFIGSFHQYWTGNGWSLDPNKVETFASVSACRAMLDTLRDQQPGTDYFNTWAEEI